MSSKRKLKSQFLDSKKFKVLALTTGQGLNSVIVILIGMIMTRVLEKQEIATYQQTFLSFRTLAPFLALGIGNGIYYFLPTEKVRIRGRVIDSILVLACMSLLFSFAIAFGGNELLARKFNNPQVARQVLWMIPYSIFMVPASHHAAVLVSQDRAALSAVYSTIVQLIVGIGTIIPLLLWQSEESAIMGNVIASCLTAVCSIILMIRISPIGPCAPSIKAMRELVAYSLPLGLATMMATLAMSLDKILVSALLGPEEFAVYSFGAREIPLIGLLMGSVTSVIIVQMRRDVSEGNHAGAVDQFRRCAAMSAPLLFPVAGFFIANAQGFITFLYTDSYKEASIPFAIYCITVLVRITTFGPLLTAYGQNWFILKRAFVELFANLILSVLGIRYFGASGAAWATVITIIFIAVPINYVRLCSLSGAKFLDFLPFKKIFMVFGQTILLFLGFLIVINSFEAYSLWINITILAGAVFFMNQSVLKQVYSQIRTNC